MSAAPVTAAARSAARPACFSCICRPKPMSAANRDLFGIRHHQPRADTGPPPPARRTVRLVWRRSRAIPRAGGTAMAKGILIAAMDFSNVAADEFNDWYDSEHIPERQRIPGFLTLQRWIGAENPRQSVATYDLDSLAVLQSASYRAIGGENLSPWSKPVTSKVERLLRYQGEQIFPGDATAPANAGGLLLIGMTP